MLLNWTVTQFSRLGITSVLKELAHGVWSYFDHVQKPENSSLQRQKNTKEVLINYKGTRMVKDGED